ncbi:hypothetical protein F53441_14127 [Fusarium austroafricanum]|uniref:Uncharacterized protein n=1 Tax=Fusarium austroafricanum TaxID=2364996 RepID=A0A8H4JJ62_9HYPO|nr:hypothetical protein F53441_14127 [Fusarium austroafricanum]
MAQSSCVDQTTQIGPSKLGLTIADFYNSSTKANPCIDLPSYIRPDDAGSILPWPYTLAWFLIHFPITLIRVHRWERVQALSLILAIITIWFQLQAYTSSTDPDSVLVWMPVFVVLDIGAMMQLAFLIVEQNGFRPLLKALPMVFSRNARRGSASISTRPRVQESVHTTAETEPKRATTENVENVEPPTQNHAEHEYDTSYLIGQAWVTLLAIVFGILLLVLQMFGLAMAIIGSQDDNVTADWCSTLFTRGLAVESGCQIYNVTASYSQGIGCITLKGYEQYTWLKGSIIIISFSLAFQVFDLVILLLVRSTTRWRGARMKRPWFTMFTGNIVLLVLIIVGVFQCQRLPNHVDQSVTVYEHIESLNQSVACVAHLTPYGVRGAVIGWTDGFLESWGDTYIPKSY